MFLLARHGTRWPTKKRLKQVDELAPFLQPVSTAARLVQISKVKASQQASWLCTEPVALMQAHPGWATPFPSDVQIAGQLHDTGGP